MSDTEGPITSGVKGPSADPETPFENPVKPSNGDRAATTDADLQALQEAGALRQEWIANPEADCPIPPCTLTFRDLRHWHKTYFNDELHDSIREKAVALGLPDDREVYVYTSMSTESRLTSTLASLGDIWVGRTGPNVLFIEIVNRMPGSTEPQSSEIAKAVFENDFNISGLRYVFVVDVVNEQTKHFAETQLYTKDGKGFVIRDTALRTWEYGTPQYRSLLGTRIGKMVAYLVLGAFQRGTRRIARIVTWYAGYEGPCMGDLQIRFDLEETS